MAGQACTRCGNPAESRSYLCGPCTTSLEVALARVPDLLGDLEVALMKQARITDAGRRSAGAEQPLPLHLGAAEALAGLNAVIRRALVLAMAGGRPPVALSAANEARWLREHVRLLARSPEAGEHVEAIVAAVAGAVALIDRPEPLAYFGVCWGWFAGAERAEQCVAELYAPASAGVVTCAVCGTQHDTARRKAWLLEQAEDQFTYASQLAQAISALGAEVSSARIRKWAERGRIISYGRDQRGRPLYRVGDVLDALQAELTKPEKSA